MSGKRFQIMISAIGALEKQVGVQSVASMGNNPISFGGEKRKTIDEISSVAPYSKIERSFVATDKTRLGANYDKKTGSINFKLASKNATDVFLCTFEDPKSGKPKDVVRMERNKDGIWETSLKADPKKPVYYGYRVFGPNWEYTEDFFNEDGSVKNPKSGFKAVRDENGARFNPNKIAFDPFAKELSHLPSDNDLGGEDAYFSLDSCFEDNASHAPKSVFSVTPDRVIKKASNRRLNDEVIGEVHIKDLSINEDVEGKGTYLGAKNLAKKIKDMGITMVEFLPLTEFDDKAGAGNHWGYMPLLQFAPAKKYSNGKNPGDALKEFREMIDALHNEDIKVCMDVVYNHTGEGATKDGNPDNAKQLSYALIDNQMYYKQKDGLYNSNSGCGNDTNTADGEVAELIADSIAFWAKQGVDAFRFDLAAALLDADSSGNVQYDDKKSLAAKLTAMLKERGVKVISPDSSGDGIYLIAEPWTCGGEGCYRIGHFPENWSEWNDVARETIKRESTFPDQVAPKDLRNILEGTTDVLKKRGRSINYVFSHDGYNLYDANTTNSPEGSWHYATDFGGDKERQIGSMKKEIALTLLSKGTPMIQMGDLIAHSKKGIDNSYNLDSDVNYLDFSSAKNEGSVQNIIYDFSTNMIKFRQNHKCIRDLNSKIEYYKKDGSVAAADDTEYWNDKSENSLCCKIGDAKPVFVSISSDDDFSDITLPKAKDSKAWKLVCDTSSDYSFDTDGSVDYETYIQKPHSLVIFEEV